MSMFYPSQIFNDIFLIDNLCQCYYPSKVSKDLMERDLRTGYEKMRPSNASYVKALIIYQLSKNLMIFNGASLDDLTNEAIFLTKKYFVHSAKMISLIELLMIFHFFNVL